MSGSDDAIEADEDLKKLTLDLFSEIAILEHLVRNREGEDEGLMSPQAFGLLNYFCRLGHSEARVSGLAWSFQEDPSYTRGKVDELVARGWLSATADDDPCVRVTEDGRAAHEQALAVMGPSFLPVTREVPREDLVTTVRTLTELRRTFDNLPDR